MKKVIRVLTIILFLIFIFSNTVNSVQIHVETVDYHGPVISVNILEKTIMIAVALLLMFLFYMTIKENRKTVTYIIGTILGVTSIVPIIMINDEYGYEGYIKNKINLIIYLTEITILIIYIIMMLILQNKKNGKQ